MKETQRVARQIVKAIMADFTDRRGLRHQWDQIDDDIRKEIIATWVEATAKILEGCDFT